MSQRRVQAVVNPLPLPQYFLTVLLVVCWRHHVPNARRSLPHEFDSSLRRSLLPCLLLRTRVEAVAVVLRHLLKACRLSCPRYQVVKETATG